MSVSCSRKFRERNLSKLFWNSEKSAIHFYLQENFIYNSSVHVRWVALWSTHKILAEVYNPGQWFRNKFRAEWIAKTGISHWNCVYIQRCLKCIKTNKSIIRYSHWLPSMACIRSEIDALHARIQSFGAVKTVQVF